MPIFYQPQIAENRLHLDEEESKHCVKVLRHVPGDVIHIIDGKGNAYKASITNNHHKKCEFALIETSFTPPPPFYIHIAIAPTKNIDRIEWFIEKATELGIQEVSFVLCKNSERKVLKEDRIIKKAISAIKQSGQAYLPKINALQNFKNFINQADEPHRYMAYVDHENDVKLFHSAPKGDKYLVLIGPEGDFGEEELEMAINKDFKKVSLGHSVLRTETAGIAACHILNLINS